MSFLSKCWPRVTNSKLLILLFIYTLVGVDSQGADCMKSKYSVLWVLPIPCAFGAYRVGTEKSKFFRNPVMLAIERY